MQTPLFGLVCLFVFASSQALRDTYFGNVFQSVSFFVVAILAFSGSTVVFGLWAWLRNRQDLRTLFANPILFSALNLTTAAAWIMYFFALKNLEPAIVATLYTGIGPIAVLTLGVMGFALAKDVAIGWFERSMHIAVIFSLTAISIVAVLGQSGLSGPSAGIRVTAVILAVSGGIFITIGHMIARRLGDLGVNSSALLGLRFPLTLALAIIAEVTLGEGQMRPGITSLPFLALAAFTLIVIPSYFLQLGIARTPPLTVNVMRALAPGFVFAAQQLDGRLHFSGATLVCILTFIFFQSIASIVSGWRQVRQT